MECFELYVVELGTVMQRILKGMLWFCIGLLMLPIATIFIVAIIIMLLCLGLAGCVFIPFLMAWFCNSPDLDFRARYAEYARSFDKENKNEM